MDSSSQALGSVLHRADMKTLITKSDLGSLQGSLQQYRAQRIGIPKTSLKHWRVLRLLPIPWQIHQLWPLHAVTKPPSMRAVIYRFTWSCDDSIFLGQQSEVLQCFYCASLYKSKESTKSAERHPRFYTGYADRSSIGLTPQRCSIRPRAPVRRVAMTGKRLGEIFSTKTPQHTV